MKKVAVVLSGCGVFDGAEIHESVLLLLELRRAGFAVEFLAPDVMQAHVINHAAGAPAEGESRNVLVEAARIARGKVKPLAGANVSEFDGIAFPGGFGVAKNLCSFAFEGPAMKVQDDVAIFVKAAAEAKKPLLFLCISPVIPAKVLGNGVEVTLGADGAAAGAIGAWGAKHVVIPVTGCHVDKQRRLVTVPAYMYDADIVEVAQGISEGVKSFAGLVG
jgi:enhancing lycopene biosynthesis protein 2